VKDIIVEETRKRREELFREFDYDIHKLSQHLIDLQSASERVYVTREMLLQHEKGTQRREE
jgi:hypothetical protein